MRRSRANYRPDSVVVVVPVGGPSATVVLGALGSRSALDAGAIVVLVVLVVLVVPVGTSTTGCGAG